MSRVLDGSTIAASIKAEVRAEVERLALQGIRPGLAAVLVGHVPASQIYVRSKVKTCEALGLFSELITPPETVTTEEMLELIDQLNARQDIDGRGQKQVVVVEDDNEITPGFMQAVVHVRGLV